MGFVTDCQEVALAMWIEEEDQWGHMITVIYAFYDDVQSCNLELKKSRLLQGC